MSEGNTITSRRRPLSTCGASTLAVAQGICQWALDLNGPIGSMTKRIAELGSVASPIINIILYHCLAALAFADNHILSIENKVEAYFPPSRHVFNKIDNMVHKVEHLPKKLQDSINKLPAMLHKIPFLDRVVIYTLKWLEFITSVLVIWTLHGAKEKEISVDANCKDQSNQIRNQSDGIMKYSYKEALEKGIKNTNLEVKHSPRDGKYPLLPRPHAAGASYNGLPLLDTNSDVAAKPFTEKDAWNWIEETDGTQVENVIATNEDPLLELFEFGWQAPKSKTPTPTISRSSSRSSSYMYHSRSNSYA